MEHKKLEQRQHEQTSIQQESVQQATIEFNSVEEMLRYDAEQVTPPARVAKRLGDSLASEGKPARPWWKRIWSKSNER